MKISVITSTYNRKNYLPMTLESVQKSIFIPFSDIELEHIVYDDASTDGTEEIFNPISPQNVKYIRAETNKGQSFGRNRAIEKAAGDYIFLIDSDDILLQRTLYNFAKAAKDHPEAKWFMSGFLRVDDKLSYLMGKDYFAWKFKDSKSHLEAIFKGEHFIQSNVFFKKELFDSVGGFDENLKVCEDLDLFIRFLLNGNQPVCSDFISHLHRHHQDSISISVTLENHKEHVEKLKAKYQNELQKQGII